MSSPHDFRLQDGTVIDHLPVGSAPKALAILELPREGPITVGINVPSARYGRKDIIRVEGLALRKSETDRLALLGPATEGEPFPDRDTTDPRLQAAAAVGRSWTRLEALDRSVALAEEIISRSRGSRTPCA